MSQPKEIIGRLVYEESKTLAPDEYAEVYGPSDDNWFEVGVGDFVVRIEADDESVDVLIWAASRDIDGMPSQLRWARQTSCWGQDRAEAMDLIAGFIARACWSA